MVPNAPGGRTENLRHTPLVPWRCKPCGKTRIPPGPEFWGYHLRRFMPSARRLFTLGGAAFVGLAATALFAAPASAHVVDVSGTSECGSDGTYTIHWTIDNKYRNQDVTLTKVQPKESGLEGKTIKGGDSLSVDQGLPGDFKGEVTLSFTAVWKDGWKDTGNPHTGSVTLKGKCKPECPPVETKGDDGKRKPPPSCPPSESPSPSPSGGTGGGEGSPTPSKSNTSPSLPVTGAQTGLYAGGAMVLLGAGAGLFFMARRRRVKFEA
jgi:LPXTG-motif cell wall-anchored protein